MIYSKVDADTEGRPGRARHLPRVRGADPRIRQGRSGQRRAATGSTTSSRSIQRRAIPSATSSSSWKARANAASSSAMSGITCSQVVSTRIRKFSEELRSGSRRSSSRRKVLEQLRRERGALVFPAHVGAPFAGHVEAARRRDIATHFEMGAEPERLKSMGKERLTAFSDGVIAIIITIMVLELKVPHGADRAASPAPADLPQLPAELRLRRHLLEQSPPSAARRDAVNGRILWANLHLLFWLSLIPFVTGWMGENRRRCRPPSTARSC